MMDWINYTLFTIAGDKPVLLIDALTSVFGLVCVFLAGRNSKYNFWIGYIYTFLLALMFWNKHLYASLLLQPISLGINILGHYRWTHPKNDEKSSADSSNLKVSMLTNRQRVAFVIAVPLLAGVLGWVLQSLGNGWMKGIIPADPVPYLDMLLTVLILAAQYLSAQKKWDCWIAWLVVNVVQITLHLSVGHIFMPIVSAMYLVNGLVSLLNWYKLYRKKA